MTITERAFDYTLEQRRKIVTDLIVERILEDQNFGSKLVGILGIREENVTMIE